MFIFLICLLALPSFAKNNDYTKLIEQNPNSSNAYLYRAQCKYKSNDFNGAIEDCNKAIQMDSKNSKAYYIRGLCNSKLNEGNREQIPKRDIIITSITKPDVDFGPYMNEIQNRIKSNWRPPTCDKSRHVVLQFNVVKDGKINSIKVLESSNFYALDLTAKRALIVSAPFPPLPSSFKEDSIDIQFSFNYNLVEQKSSNPFNALLMFSVINNLLHGTI